MFILNPWFFFIPDILLVVKVLIIQKFILRNSFKRVHLYFDSLTWPLFEQFPFLNKTGEDIDEVFENWKKYKYSVPVYGAILLNQNLDKVKIILSLLKLRVQWILCCWH